MSIKSANRMITYIFIHTYKHTFIQCNKHTYNPCYSKLLNQMNRSIHPYIHPYIQLRHTHTYTHRHLLSGHAHGIAAQTFIQTHPRGQAVCLTAGVPRTCRGGRAAGTSQMSIALLCTRIVKEKRNLFINTLVKYINIHKYIIHTPSTSRANNMREQPMYKRTFGHICPH